MQNLDRPTKLDGYPTEKFRLDELNDPNITIPSGPWDASINTLPSDEEKARFQSAGLRMDKLGRPLHPDLGRMILEGVYSNKGFYWQWGPNYTVDPVVLTESSILLIRRSDTGKWALPGGFIDGGETAIAAARRETLEETGLDLRNIDGQIVYSGAVTDVRTTAHAWADTTAVRFMLASVFPVEASDDAIDARWFNLDALPRQLHGSHTLLIEKAKQWNA